jgi:hypothetical protein
MKPQTHIPQNVPSELSAELVPRVTDSAVMLDPRADEPVYQLPLRRWLVDRIVTEHHRELAVEGWTGLDRPSRCRYRQDAPPGWPTHKASG